MRIAQYATAIASACLFAHSLAAPTDAKVANEFKQDGGKAKGEEANTSGEKGSDVSGAKLLEDMKDHDWGTKYFHEPGADDILGHYDIRYFHDVVTYEERTDTLTHLIRSYLTFFREEGLETWIAHGTLLGWWWNGQMLPWDWDVDTQVSHSTLQYMAKHYNRTVHEYVSVDKKVKRKYLLDVNPWIWERERGDGQNVIDARWIDVRNGLYIDITGLSETHPETMPGIWVCKNYHRYRTADLYPMRESTYEGVPAKIPYAYDKILMEEYRQKALVLTQYEGHTWVADRKEWVKTEDLTKEQPEK